MNPKTQALSLPMSLIGIVFFALSAMAQTGTKPPAMYPAQPSEIPAQFTPKTDSFDYTRRKVMIPMRDGVKLYTVILIPKGAKGAPILLTRTPYSADDWFHYGAFRQINVSWIYNQVATRKGEAKWWRSHNDEYDMFMQAGSAGKLGRRRGLDQLGFWNKLVDHPAYDAFWQDQAVDKVLAANSLKTPVMLVHSLWDQEDIYGAPAVYKAIEPQDTANDKVFLVIGPWYHGQMIGNGSSLGALKFGSDTALYFRKRILAPFLAQHLKDGAPRASCN